MATFKKVEVVVVVDADGEYAVGVDADDAGNNYDASYDTSVQIPRRLVRITLNVPLPQVVELEAEIPEEPATGELTVK